MNSRPEPPRYSLILGSLLLIAYAAYNLGAAWMATVPENAFFTPTPTATLTPTPSLTPTHLLLIWITPTLRPGEASVTPEITATPSPLPAEASPTPTLPPIEVTLTPTPTVTSGDGGYPGPEATQSPTPDSNNPQNPYPGVPTSTSVQNPYPGVPTSTSVQNPYPGITPTPTLNPAYPGPTQAPNPTLTPLPGQAATPTPTATLLLATPTITLTPSGPTLTPGATTQPVDRLPFTQVLVLTGGGINGVAWAAQPNLLALATSKGVYLYDVTKLAERSQAVFDEQNSILSVRFALGDTVLVAGRADGSINGWEITTGRYLGMMTGHFLGVVRLDIPNAGNFLVSGSDDATVKVWDLSGLPNQGASSTRLLRTFTGPVSRVTDLDVSASGNLVAAASQQNVHIWNPTTGELRKNLRQPVGWYTALAFSPDDQTLVTAYDGRRLEFWDVITWRRLDFIPLSAGVRTLAYSPDGRFLAVGYENDRIQIWGVRSKVLLADLPGHPGLSSMAFDAASSQLATSSLDGNLRLWDVSQLLPP